MPQLSQDVAESENWGQHRRSGGSRGGAVDLRLKTRVSGGVLLLQLSLFNMDLISCFPT